MQMSGRLGGGWRQSGGKPSTYLRRRRGQPSVSVVVPFYNSAPFAERRLASILDQGYPIAELIMLDDASSDDTVATVQAYAKRRRMRACLITNEVNSGSPWTQWRRALERLSGDLVWIAEADDIAHPDFLVSLAPQFGNPALSIAFANTCIVDGDERIVFGDTRRWLVSDGIPWDRRFILPGPTFLERQMCVQNGIINVSGVVFRRQVLVRALNRLGKRLQNFRSTGDWLIYCECLQSGQVAFEPSVLNACRRRADSLSSRMNKERHFLDSLNVQRHALDILDRPLSASERAVTFSRVLAHELGVDPMVAAALIEARHGHAEPLRGVREA